MAAQPQLACLLTLKKIVPHLVQLGNCRLEWRDEEPFAFTSHDSKAVESLERIGHFEIKVDREIFRKPRLDTTCNLGRRWRCKCPAQEVSRTGDATGFMVTSRLPTLSLRRRRRAWSTPAKNGRLRWIKQRREWSPGEEENWPLIVNDDFY